MMDYNLFIDESDKISDCFAEFFEKHGYSVYFKEEGNGAIACKEDKFAPIFSMSAGRMPHDYSIFVLDRNGYFALSGEFAAIYSLRLEDEQFDIEKIKDNFNILLEDVYKKYSKYNRENRLDFVYNNMETDRKEYCINDKEKVLE